MYMLDDKQDIEEQHKLWELKTLSTWLYLTDVKENKIIPLVSQKRSHRFRKKNVLHNSYNVFYRWLKFYDDVDK